MQESATDCRVIGATVKIEICKKVERKYRLSKSDSLSTVYARALEDASRDVMLTAQDYAEIQKEIEANEAKRQAAREKRKLNRKLNRKPIK